MTKQQDALTPFVIHAFMVYRLSSFLVHRAGTHQYESGPFNVFEKLRKAAGVTYHADGYGVAGQADYPAKQPNELAKTLVCMWCCSVWVGFAVALLNGKGIAYGLSLSAAALSIDHYMG